MTRLRSATNKVNHGEENLSTASIQSFNPTGQSFVDVTLEILYGVSTVKAALRAQAATIRNLEGRLKRSRDIDLRIDQKERELLR